MSVFPSVCNKFEIRIIPSFYKIFCGLITVKNLNHWDVDVWIEDIILVVEDAEDETKDKQCNYENGNADDEENPFATSTYFIWTRNVCMSTVWYSITHECFVGTYLVLFVPHIFRCMRTLKLLI